MDGGYEGRDTILSPTDGKLLQGLCRGVTWFDVYLNDQSSCLLNIQGVSGGVKERSKERC